MIVLVKDLRGIRLQKSLEETDTNYRLDNGMVVGRDKCWPATSHNVGLAMVDLASKGKITLPYRHLEKSFDLIELEAAQIVVMLRKQGYDIDSELRVRKRMGPPFTELTDQHIMPIIASHLKKSEKQKKSPEKVPVRMGMIEGQIVFEHEGQLATGQQEGGSISIVENQRVVLTFMDWHYVPRSSNVGMLVHYLKCEPTGASSMKELCGKEQVLFEDGFISKWGLRELVKLEQKIDFKDASVEDIIGDLEL